MKKFFNKGICFFLVLSILFYISGCSNDETENDANNKSDKMTFYVLEDEEGHIEGGLIYELMKMYNNYCEEKLDDSYKIEFVKFDNLYDMNTKMSTEIMTGKGPDLFSIEQLLPFEKMFDNNSFCDITQLAESDKSNSKLNLSEYNQNIFNACKYKDKQYILPIFYGMRCLTAEEKVLEKFNMSTKQGERLCYDTLDKKLNGYLSNQQNTAFLFGDSDDFFMGSKELFYQLIYDFVDFENGKTYFDTPQFKAGVDTLCNLVNLQKNVSPEKSLENYIFDTYFLSKNFFGLAQRNYLYPTVVYNGFSKNEDDITGFLQMGIAVNANSSHKDKVLEFIKYALCDRIQERFTGDADGYYSNTSFPVRNETFENEINAIKEFNIAMLDSPDEEIDNNDTSESVLEENNDSSIEGKTKSSVIDATDTELMKTYINMVRSINKCDIYTYVASSYYCYKVIQPICSDYFGGKITKEQLISKLTSATKIYLSE